MEVFNLTNFYPILSGTNKLRYYKAWCEVQQVECKILVHPEPIFLEQEPVFGKILVQTRLIVELLTNKKDLNYSLKKYT